MPAGRGPLRGTSLLHRIAWTFCALVLLLAPGCGGDDDSDPIENCDSPNMVCTIMGNGEWAFAGEGATPLEVSLYWPIDLAVDSEDRLLVLDWNNFRVRRLDHDGIVRTILGTGVESEAIVNGVPALQTALHHTFSMSFDDGGRLFLAGNHVPVVIRMDTDTLVWTIAGVAQPGYEGDDGPAVDAQLNTPCGVAVAPGGSPIYVADTANHCIRSIDAQGVITTIAGDGQPGANGDGGPAAQARLSTPMRIRVDAATGDLYIADQGNHKIRKIDGTGMITTVAGGDSAGYSGDGGPAAGAKLNAPLDARVGPDGALYIADTNNHRIRRVSSAGIISTVVGSGFEGTRLDAMDSGPPASINLRGPSVVAFDALGNLYIGDTYNSVVRRVRLSP